MKYVFPYISTQNFQKAHKKEFQAKNSATMDGVSLTSKSFISPIQFIHEVVIVYRSKKVVDCLFLSFITTHSVFYIEGYMWIHTMIIFRNKLNQKQTGAFQTWFSFVCNILSIKRFNLIRSQFQRTVILQKRKHE